MSILASSSSSSFFFFFFWRKLTVSLFSPYHDHT